MADASAPHRVYIRPELVSGPWTCVLPDPDGVNAGSRGCVRESEAVRLPGRAGDSSSILAPPLGVPKGYIRTMDFSNAATLSASSAAHGGSILPFVDASAFTEACVFRGAMAVVGGAVLGFVFGAAFSGYSSLSPYDGIGMPISDTKISAAQALKEGFNNMKVRGISTGKNFAVVGGVYSTIECGLDKWRGKRDLKNALVAGAATGAILAARAGPRAMVFGATTFAGFSLVMEAVIPRWLDH